MIFVSSTPRTGSSLLVKLVADITRLPLLGDPFPDSDICPYVGNPTGYWEMTEPEWNRFLQDHRWEEEGVCKYMPSTGAAALIPSQYPFLWVTREHEESVKSFFRLIQRWPEPRRDDLIERYGNLRDGANEVIRLVRIQMTEFASTRDQGCVHVVDYRSLINGDQNTLKDLARFLGKPETRFLTDDLRLMLVDR